MISYDPLLPMWMIWLLLGLTALVGLLSLVTQTRNVLWRGLLASAIAITLLHPLYRREHRISEADTALVLVDTSASMMLDHRGIEAEALARTLSNAKLKNLVWRRANIPAAGQNQERTDGYTALQNNLAQIASDRLAGTIIITDGQFHDQPQLDRLKALHKPVHVVIVGDPQMIDRRITILAAPPFAIVDSHAHPIVKIDDGSVGIPITLNWQLNGIDQSPVPALTGTPIQLDVPITRRGPADITVSVPALAGERVISNNQALFTINGVRDRLNVLLVTGTPYPGARLWRDTLKSDPSIDLIHFTILRLPSSVDAARNDELSLIPFPVNQLFEERLGSFDLVIFDRYSALDLLQPDYFSRLANYVKVGGALLVVAGPEYDSPQSLATTGLSAVLPAMPGDAAPTVPFKPEITALGLRHPVVSGLQRSWGPWYRFTRSRAVAGQTLMQAGTSPLLQVNDYGRGRVAMLMSDQLWLWARSDQTGPWDDLVRRVAHWLMKEPDLEAEHLGLSSTTTTITADRRSLGAVTEPMLFTLPDGRQISKPLTMTATGQTAVIPLAGPGLYTAKQGQLTARLNVGTDTPEFTDIQPTDKIVRTVAEATGGGISFGKLPDLRRIKAGGRNSGSGWFGLVENGGGRLESIEEVPLLPSWLALLIISTLAVLTWWQERG